MRHSCSILPVVQPKCRWTSARYVRFSPALRLFVYRKYRLIEWWVRSSVRASSRDRRASSGDLRDKTRMLRTPLNPLENSRAISERRAPIAVLGEQRDSIRFALIVRCHAASLSRLTMTRASCTAALLPIARNCNRDCTSVTSGVRTPSGHDRAEIGPTWRSSSLISSEPELSRPVWKIRIGGVPPERYRGKEKETQREEGGYTGSRRGLVWKIDRRTYD